MKKPISILIGIIIFSGLPLLGWDIMDIGGFIQNPIRLIYIIMMALLSSIVAIIVPESGRSHGVGKKLMQRHKLSLLYLQIIPLLIVIMAPYFDHNEVLVWNENDITRYVGLGITFIGFIFMNWSVMILDKQFSVDVTIQEDHNLITKGPYYYIRHPRYLGIIIFFTGISLTFRSWISLFFVFMTIIVLIWRIKDEERLLQEEFETDWENYKAKTYALLPFLF